ncbi:MAG: ATPase, T2SS/T4P/T4SS family [Planctomycetota bacterium]
MEHSRGEQATHSPLAMRQIVYPLYRSNHRADVVPLGRRLIEAGLIREDQLQTALAHQASEERRLRAIAAEEGTDSIGRLKRTRFKRLGEVVVELGLVDEAHLLPIMGEQLGVEGIKLCQGLIDPEAVRLVPHAVAERLRALPILRVRDTLTVAMADPQDLGAIDTLADVSGCLIRPVLTLAEGIDRLLPHCYADDYCVDPSSLSNFPRATNENTVSLDDVSVSGMGQGTSGLLHYALSQAIRQNASAIHFEPGAPLGSIRFRVDGILRDAIEPKRETHDELLERLKSLGGLNSESEETSFKGHFHVRIARREIKMHLTVLSTVAGERAVIRILERESFERPLDQLGLSPAQYKTTTELLDQAGGLLILCGPRDSGITTTLYSFIEHLKSKSKGIIALERSRRLSLDRVCQIDWSERQSNLLENAISQDPDVLVLECGQKRQDARDAVQAAASGRLVIYVMHADEGAAALQQFLGWQTDPSLVASTLIGTISQRLIRRICPSCSEIHHPEIEMLQSLGMPASSLSYARGRGCAECHETGYHGRVAIFEIAVADDPLRSSNVSSSRCEAITELGSTVSLFSAALKLAEEHVTSLEEVFRCLNRAKGFQGHDRVFTESTQGLSR